jgi:hypothetical protein
MIWPMNNALQERLDVEQLTPEIRVYHSAGIAPRVRFFLLVAELLRVIASQEQCSC